MPDERTRISEETAPASDPLLKPRMQEPFLRVLESRRKRTVYSLDRTEDETFRKDDGLSIITEVLAGL